MITVQHTTQATVYVYTLLCVWWPASHVTTASDANDYIFIVNAAITFFQSGSPQIHESSSGTVMDSKTRSALTLEEKGVLWIHLTLLYTSVWTQLINCGMGDARGKQRSGQQLPLGALTIAVHLPPRSNAGFAEVTSLHTIHYIFWCTHRLTPIPLAPRALVLASARYLHTSKLLCNAVVGPGDLWSL